MLAIFNLLTNIITTSLTCIGIATVLNKTGKFFKIIEENKEDGFKKGFDTIVLESIEEINRCVESISLIINNSNKMAFIIYDITVGNKIIKKDSNGKIVICSKSKAYSNFKEKINELSTKVKKYKDELLKIKKEKTILPNPDSDSESNSDSDSLVSSNSKSSSESNNEELTNLKEEEEFYLES